MTDLITIARDLSLLSADLDQATEDLIEADAHAVESEHSYKLAYARAFMEASGAVAVKETVALLASEQERWDAEIAKQVLRAAKARLDGVRTRIDVARSLSAMTRSEMALGGFVT
jgi:hypothetical protein